MYTRRLINCLGGLNTGSTNLANTIGNIFTTGGNIGINKVNPSYLVDINGSLNTTNLLTSSSTITNTAITNLSAGSGVATIGTLVSATSSIGTLAITNLSAGSGVATIGTVISTTSSIGTLAMTNLSAGSGVATIGTIISTTASIGNIVASNITAGSFVGVGAIPTGTLLMWAATAAPTGYLLCDGSAISRTTYAALFSLIGTTYGVGDNINTFNVPDLRSKVPLGVGQGPGLTNRVLGNTGGSETHTLTIAEMPSHNHSGTTASDGSHTHTGTTDSNGNHQHDVTMDAGNFGGGTLGMVYHNFASGTPTYLNATNVTGAHTHTFTTNAGGSHTHGFTTGSVGGGAAHNNMQPFLVINYIIKT